MSKVDELEELVKFTLAHGYDRMYVETGRYKGVMPNTVRALAFRGYKIECVPGPRAGAFYVYPKQEAAIG